MAAGQRQSVVSRSIERFDFGVYPRTGNSLVGQQARDLLAAAHPQLPARKKKSSRSGGSSIWHRSDNKRILGQAAIPHRVAAKGMFAFCI